MEKLLEYFVPEGYELKIDINKAEKRLRGTAVIRGEALAENIKFHAVGLSVSEVLIDGKKVDFEMVDGLLTLKKVPRGVFGVEIGYNGSLNENMEGAYLSTYKYNGKTEQIVATQFESHYAREAFPCIDEPAAKATFKMMIKSDDAEDLILSNMPLVEKKDGYVYFAETPRMSTYLLAFVVGKFHGKTITNKHGVKITTYAALNQPVEAVDFANEVAAKSLDYYDDEFGVKYPLEKCDQVALPDFEAGAMENWGLVTYRESMLLADTTATISTKKSIALTVAHELSHQWFGDLVTMQWWDDLWLNESFASIMEYMAVEELYPDFNIWENFFTNDCLRALKRDAYAGVQAVHQEVYNVEDIANLFDGAIVYSKGARLMLMLMRAMGWENFRKGLKDYFEKYAYKNTVGDDLWRALSPYADFDVKGFMHKWIDEPGYPVVESDGTQKRFRLEGELVDSDYPIPHLFDDMSGHYLIRLPEDELKKKLAEFDTLSMEQKLRLLIDLDLMSRTDLVASESLFELLMKFKNENSAAVWSMIATIVAGLKVFVEPDSDDEKRLKRYVGELIGEKLQELGLKTGKNDAENTIRLRGILVGMNYYAENVENLQKIAAMYNDNYALMDAEMRADVLEAKLYLEPELLGVYLQRYQEETDPEIQFDLLAAMTLVRDEKNIERMVGLLGEPEIIKPQEHLYLYIYLYRNPRARSKTFEWLKNNWNYVKQMAGDKTIADYPRYTANVVKNTAEAEEFWQFFAGMKEDLALARTLKVAETEINSRLVLVERDYAGVSQWLKNNI